MTGIENPFDAVPPHDGEIEQCVLGAMLMESLATEVAIEMLTHESFYVARNRWLFPRFVNIFNRVHALDEKLACASLFKENVENKDELRNYIGRLIVNTPSAANIEGYCGTLLRFQDDRKRLRFALRMIRQIFECKKRPFSDGRENVRTGMVDGTRPVLKSSPVGRGETGNNTAKNSASSVARTIEVSA